MEPPTSLIAYLKEIRDAEEDTYLPIQEEDKMGSYNTHIGNGEARGWWIRWET